MITARDCGFRVRIVGRNDEWDGRTGVLLRSPPEGEEDRRWTVRVDDFGVAWFFPYQLERIPATQLEGSSQKDGDG